MTRTRGGVAGAVFVLLLVARIGGASAAPGAPASTVSVVLSDLGMKLSRPTVPTGQVVFEVENSSSQRRDFGVTGKNRTGFLSSGGRASLRIAFASFGPRSLRSIGARGTPTRVLQASLRVVAQPRRMLILPSIKLTRLAGSFAAPVDVVAPPGDETRLMVVQQNGVVSLIENGVQQDTPFLDLRNVVVADGEKGLLSIAFAPDYATSGLVYAYYNNRDGNIRLIEYHRSAANPDVVDQTRRRLILALTKPTADHNGGMMQFGPDGYLYIGVGDGGANPPTIPVGVTGQTLDDLFGSILRIDPRSGNPYAIPAGNPFVAVAGARPEIVAYGLRNPWRFSIDPTTNGMLIGDVGEETREEIDLLRLDALGANFGWPCEEGTAVPDKVTIPASCKTATLAPPLLEYPHSDTRCSVIGGVTIRDPRLPTLDGLFLWTDFCEGEIYALDTAMPSRAEIPLGVSTDQPTSFGTDASGRVYVTTSGGALFRIDPT